MSDLFLVVAPPEFEKVAISATAIDAYGASSLADAIEQSNWPEVYTLLEINGLMPEGKDVAAAKFFVDGGEYHLWVLFSQPAP